LGAAAGVMAGPEPLLGGGCVFGAAGGFGFAPA
jgi:hypothetical protein